MGEVANTTMRSMKVLSQKIEQMVLGFEPLEQAVIDKKVELAASKAKMESAQKKLEEAETQINTLREIIRESRKAYEDCIEDFSISHQSCLDLKLVWDEAKSDMSKFRSSEYRNKRSVAEDTAEEFSILSGKFAVYQNRYIEAIAPTIELQNRISALNIKVMELYTEYTKLEGATGQIIWTVPWDRLLEDYRKVNKNLGVKWAPLPLKEAELISTIKLGNDLSASVSSLKSAVIVGAKATGFAGIGTGQKVAGPQTVASAPTEASAVFGNSVSGQIVLTLAGACPYLGSIDDEGKKDISGLTSHMLARLVYNYEVVVRRSYTAKYNLSQLLKKIEEKIQSGGLFSTNDAHHILNEGNSLDWFSMEFDGNTSEFKYSAEEQKQIKQEVKYELMDKALKQFSVLNAGSSLPPPVPQFLETGAGAASRELRQCWHHYCQAASAVIGVANSIWGNSQAVANFHRNNNAWSYEKVNGIEFVSRSGSLAFKAE